MIRLPNDRVTCLIFVLALAAGCQRGNHPLEALPLTTVAQDIQRRGYDVKESQIVSPTLWEVSTLRMRNKRYFSFRADQPQAGTRDYYCRFTLFEETYDSVDDARNRLANLHVAAPDGPVIDEYRLTMRRGFRIGTVTYFLETDASIFWDEVNRLAMTLANSTAGAELTRARQIGR